MSAMGLVGDDGNSFLLREFDASRHKFLKRCDDHSLVSLSTQILNFNL